MAPLAVSGIAFACVVGGAVLGLLVRRLLPAHHMSADSKDAVKLGMGLVATMAALVLGLLVASAKGSYDAQRGNLITLSTNAVLLDRVLAHYGPDAAPIRDALRGAVTAAHERIWPSTAAAGAQLAPAGAGREYLYDAILRLAPQTDAQRATVSQAQSLAMSLGQTYWLLFEQSGSAISAPLLTIVVLWLTILFCSFALFAPPNGTVLVALFVSALSVAGALFLILEMDRPFAGVIRISDEPMRNALAQLGRES
jgi:hypothetical protein